MMSEREPLEYGSVPRRKGEKAGSRKSEPIGSPHRAKPTVVSRPVQIRSRRPVVRRIGFETEVDGSVEANNE